MAAEAEVAADAAAGAAGIGSDRRLQLTILTGNINRHLRRCGFAGVLRRRMPRPKTAPTFRALSNIPKARLPL